MAAPADEEVLAAVLAVKSAHPDYGLARLRSHIKEANGWELSEKRVKKALAAAAEHSGDGVYGRPSTVETECMGAGEWPLTRVV